MRVAVRGSLNSATPRSGQKLTSIAARCKSRHAKRGHTAPPSGFFLTGRKDQNHLATHVKTSSKNNPRPVATFQRTADPRALRETRRALRNANSQAHLVASQPTLQRPASPTSYPTPIKSDQGTSAAEHDATSSTCPRCPSESSDDASFFAGSIVDVAPHVPAEEVRFAIPRCPHCGSGPLFCVASGLVYP